jgi:hypothetical protein
MYGRKFILVEASENSGDCYDCGSGYSEPFVTVIDSLSELVKRLANEIGQDRMAVQELAKNEHVLKALDQLGIRNIEKIEDEEKKATVEKRFFVHDAERGFSSLREIDFDKLSRYDGERLASDKTMILQSITKPSLKRLAPGVYDAMNKAKKRSAAAAEAKRAKAAERAEKKRQKEIDEARKLLEAAGELK